MSPETLRKLCPERSNLWVAIKENEQAISYFGSDFEKLSSDERRSFGEVAYSRTQKLLHGLYSSGEDEQITEEGFMGDDEEIMYQTTEKVLRTKDFGMIFIERTSVIHSSGEQYLGYTAGIKPADEFCDTAENLQRLLYFIPDEQDWDDYNNFTWVHNGLETISHIALAQGTSTALQQT